MAGTAVRPGGVSAGIGRKDQGLVADVVIPVSLRGGPQAGGKALGRQVGRHGGPAVQPARGLPPDHAVQPVEVDESLPDPYVGVVRVIHRAGAEVDRRERGTGEPVELRRADRIGLGVSGRIGTDQIRGPTDRQTRSRHQFTRTAFAQVPGQNDTENIGPAEFEPIPGTEQGMRTA